MANQSWSRIDVVKIAVGRRRTARQSLLRYRRAARRGRRRRCLARDLRDADREALIRENMVGTPHRFIGADPHGTGTTARKSVGVKLRPRPQTWATSTVLLISRRITRQGNITANTPTIGSFFDDFRRSR